MRVVRRDRMSLPFPFSLIPYLVIGIWIAMIVAMVAVVAGAVWLGASGQMTPESVGGFFGRIAGAFMEQLP